ERPKGYLEARHALFPACMAACPTHALICVDRNKLEQLSAEKRRRTALMF
ncbi:hypothetical protein AAIH37_36920, partial [Pseudomonas aeruginosa]